MFGYTIISKERLKELEKQASGTKFTPNEIRRIFGLDLIEEE